MPIQEALIITKETQKIVLKAMCESPTLTPEELAVLLKSQGKKLSQEEVINVIHGISPNKNWHRATKEDVQREILEYVWTLEAQVLFLLPTKQKETTTAEFNQIRLQNKQPKVQKDIIRHLQTLLMVESKNLSKFRKFEKELSLQSDTDVTTQAVWSIRIILANINIDLITEVQELPAVLLNQSKEKFPILSEKTGKTIQRICERFTEKYFPKYIDESKLKELINAFQVIYHTYKKGSSGEFVIQGESQDQSKLIQNAIEQLKEIQEVLNESQEGSLLSKLFTSKIKGKDGALAIIDQVINSLNQITDINIKTNKNISEKVLVIQKLQSDYENVVLVKNQLETDLYNLNHKLKELEEKNEKIEKELQNKTELLEKAYEKIATLQQKVDEIPDLEAKVKSLREELGSAKDIALRLYNRVTKIKADLLKQSSEKPKMHKINNGSKTNTINSNKNKQEESIQTLIITEPTVNAQ